MLLYAIVWILPHVVLTVNNDIATAPSWAAATNIYADVSTNVSLPCFSTSLNWPEEELLVMWIREGKTLHHSHIEKNGSLTLQSVTSRDTGVYQCKVDSSIPKLDSLGSLVMLHVKTPPQAPLNVTVYPSTVLALVMWKLGDDGGYPVKRVTVIFQKVTDDFDDPAWRRTYPEHVGSGMTQLEVYRLEPNTTYRFRVWATNKLGPGDYTEVVAHTKPQGDHNGMGNPIITVSKDFDTRIWVAAVSVVFGTLLILVAVLVTFVLIDRKFRRRRRRRADYSEDVELLPNITTNPTFREDSSAGRMVPTTSEQNNDRQSLTKLNSNSVVRL